MLKAIGVLSVALGVVTWLWVQEIKDSAQLEVANRIQEEQRDFDLQIGRLNQQLLELEGAYQQELFGLQALQEKELSALRGEIEDAYKKEPFNAANDVERHLALFSCLYESGNDRDKRASCHVRASSSYSPERSATVAVTPETTQQWAELCEVTGSRDYCEYIIVGFRKEFFLEFQQFLYDIDRDQLQLRDRLDSERAFRERMSSISESSQSRKD